MSRPIRNAVRRNAYTSSTLLKLKQRVSAAATESNSMVAAVVFPLVFNSSLQLQLQFFLYTDIRIAVCPLHILAMLSWTQGTGGLFHPESVCMFKKKFYIIFNSKKIMSRMHIAPSTFLWKGFYIHGRWTNGLEPNWSKINWLLWLLT